MKRGSTLFLKAVIVCIGIGVLAFLLWEPSVEGRNINATPIEMYFNDPFLAYVYISSIAFFVALYQTVKLLGYIEQDKVFSQISVSALRCIKYCAITLSGLIILGVLYIQLSTIDDDPAGITALGIITGFISIVVATGSAVLERLLRNAVDLKSEKDLAV